jgi:5'-methylthioadenosine phosphorylase
MENLTEKTLATPFGYPSDAITVGQVAGIPVAFLPRHGRGHRLLPSEINYRANIHALKQLGVSHIVTVNSVGSLQEEYPPGHVVIPDQILDKTTGLRPRTFFGEGAVGHVSLAEPFCTQLSQWLVNACQKADVVHTHGGTSVCIEGPRFSTKAESEDFRRSGARIVGMTAMPEAILAREAEIPYASLSFVTDYDCWRPNTEHVSVEQVMAMVAQNTAAAKRVLEKLIPALPKTSTNPIFSAAEFAILTAPHLIPEPTKERLEFLYGPYFKK